MNNEGSGTLDFGPWTLDSFTTHDLPLHHSRPTLALSPPEIIARKRDGARLTPEEIATFVRGFTAGDIPDYQMSALAMAIYFRGMDAAETACLTDSMLHSGSVLTWPAGGPPKVDKHSTGGIADKSSLVLAPLLACCGLAVPMISGRGLGPTGGTLDKLESIPGFRTDLDEREIRNVVDRVDCVITGATKNLVPADRKLYALRDVTGTVPSIPLICASIMSKKLAEGLDALVLDVKFGSGAFMKSLDAAGELARLMVDTGERMGVRTTALLTDMNQPTGRMAGNAVEVNEAIEIMQGRGPADLRELVLRLAAEVLLMTNIASDERTVREKLDGLLRSGSVLEKFRQMVAAQGGNFNAPRPVAPGTELRSRRAGFIQQIDAEALGLAIIELGGGRTRAGAAIDHSVGLELLVRIGDAVEHEQPLVRIFARGDVDQVARRIEAAITIGDEPVTPPPLIVERITGEGRR